MDETAAPALEAPADTGDNDGYSTAAELAEGLTAPDEDGEPEAAPAPAAETPPAEPAEEPAPAAQPEPWQLAMQEMQRQNMEFQKQLMEGFQQSLAALRPPTPETPAAPVDRYEAMARQNLGEHAPAHLVAEAAALYKNVAAYEAHQRTMGDDPKYQAGLHAERQKLGAVEGTAKAIAEVRAENAKLRAEMEEMRNAPQREAATKANRDDVAMFLRGDVAGIDAAKVWPDLAKEAREAGTIDEWTDALLDGLDPAAPDYMKRLGERGAKLNALAAKRAAKAAAAPAEKPALAPAGKPRLVPPTLSARDGAEAGPPGPPDDEYPSAEDIARDAAARLRGLA